MSISLDLVRRVIESDGWTALGKTEETTVKVMVLIKANEDSEAGKMPPAELFEAMGKYNEELVKAGIMLAGEGLLPSSRGKRVLVDGTKRSVVDGPFAETKELIAGFWIFQVKSMDEAVEWVKRVPNPMGEKATIEIRQIASIEDFGDAMSPELREQEERLRQQVENKGKA